MTASLSGVFNTQNFTDAGALAASYRLYTYSPSTTTQKVAYTDAAASVAHTYTADGSGGFYLALNARGELPAPLFLTTGGYDLCLKTSAGVTVWTRRATGIADSVGSLSATTGAGLVGYSATATYTAGTVGAWMQREIYVADYGTDLTAVQTAIDRAYALGGGTVYADPAVTYTGSTAPVLKTGVMFDGRWCTLAPAFGAGNVYGVRVVTRSGIRRCTITPSTAGVPSSQFVFHCPVTIGAPNNNGDSVASPDPFQTATEWLIEDLVITPCRQYGPMIQGIGNVSNGVVRNIYQPSNANGSGVHFDWGNVGTVSSSAIATTRTAFDANLAYTTHPHNILIENIRVGTLSVAVASDLGASVVRLSACHGITVRNLQCDSVTLTVYRHVGGDLGYEFAPATVKPYACKGNTLDGVVINAPTASFLDGVYIDTLADNIYREQFAATPYTPLMDPMMHADIRVTADFCGPNVASGYGARIIQSRGVKIIGGSYQKFDIGIWVDEFTRDIDVEGVAVFANRSDGIKVGQGGLRESSERIAVRRCKLYGNGTAGTGYGINAVRSISGNFEDNSLGTTDEATQDVGLVIADNGYTLSNNVRRNHCFGATLAAYSIPGSSAPYYFDQIGEWVSNTAELSLPQTPISISQDQIPIRNLFQFSRWVKEYITNITSDPSTGHWKDGSLLLYRDAVSASPAMKSCTTSGSFGTLSGLTNGVTNSTNVITCSLAATTATVTLGTFPSGYYSCVVASATNLRVGLLCSIAGSVTDARIIDISGTTIQFDKPCKAVVGAAFTTAGLIEGEVISINTTTPKSSCVVMKITGTTVTLDTAMVDTQTLRTLSYTAPVFKAHANIA